MNSPRILLFILLKLAFTSQALAGGLQCPRGHDSRSLYLSASKELRRDFHMALINAHEAWSIQTNYQDEHIREQVSWTIPVNSPAGSFADLLMSRAHAQSTNTFCTYGGWLSLLQRGECLAPWNRSVRAAMSDLGPVYDGNFTCGAAGLFRCNPILFGGPRDDIEGGYCVETDDRDPKLATSTCLEHFDAVLQEELLESLINNPEKLVIYLGVAAETIRFCESSAGESFSACRRLVDIVKKMSQRAMNCVEAHSLYPYLPSIVTPLNANEIDRIAGGLAEGFREYQLDLERRQAEAHEQNKELYELAFTEYTNSAATREMIRTLDRNLTRCIGDSCRGSKSRTRSVAYCARYVKYGMLQPFLGGRYPGAMRYVYAANSHRWLEPAGFQNLMEIPGMENMTPETAPVGAVIVYERSSGRRTPGHIEVKTGAREYMSDFVTSTPTRLGGQRRVIGIYIKLPSDIEDRLVEVPEV